jgi:cell division protein FtsI (penicillin-binding protein 3)
MNGPSGQQRPRRVAFLSVLLASFFAAIALRLVMLTVFDGTRLSGLARTEHFETVKLNGARGPIVDRYGTPLALSAESRSVFARPSVLLRNSSPAERAKLARMLDLSETKLDERLASRAHFVWLARQIEPSAAQAIERLNLAGVGSVPEFKRFYPERNLAGVVVGMAGVDNQGLSGVELSYDSLIRGAQLKLEFAHDAHGRPLLDNPAELKQAQPGARVVLTIDAAIQALAENELSRSVRQVGAQRGSVVVLDPFTGEVLAMAAAKARAQSDSSRLHDPAIESVFEPGSTIKGLLGAIALEDRVITPRTKLFCENGQMKIGAITIHDHGSHQWLDIGQIIAVSSNIGAAKIALALGPERYFSGLRAFGLGQPTGIDLPGEAAGLLHPPTQWKPIELANHGFGQGLAVTPLQLAVAYAAIANGGLVMRPYVVKAMYDPSGRPLFTQAPQVVRRAISPAVAHQMSALLRAVVESADGTGRRAAIENVSVAGKTGTAQMVDPLTRAYYRHRLVASFVGFLPAEEPRLVILVALEGVGEGRFGGLVAAPVFRTIALPTLERLRIAPKAREQRAAGYETAELLPLNLLAGGWAAAQSEDKSIPSFAELLQVPAFTGLSLRQALALARRLDLDIKAVGSGYVVAQNPPPKTQLGTQRRVEITLEENVNRLAVQMRRGSPRAADASGRLNAVRGAP